MDRVLVIISIFLGVSCVGLVSKNHEGEASKKPKTALFVILDFKLEGKNRGKDCKLELQHSDGEYFSTPIVEGEYGYFMQVKPGRFKFKQINCGLLNKYSLEETLSPIVAQERKYGYLGWFSFRVIDSRNLEVGIKRYGPDKASSFLGQLPSDANWKMYSPYTLKTIDYKMFDMTPDRITNTFLGLELAEQELIELPSLKLCLEEEKKFNPLRVGKLEVKISFVDFRVNKIDIADTPHTYSKQFEFCVQRQLKQASIMIRKPVQAVVEL